jgi:hypothetical protein
MDGRFRDSIGNERGATIALVAVSMVALLGAAALAIDVGNLLNARTAAQRTADAMALAAASAFIDDPANAQAVAAQRATEYAQENPVLDKTAAFDPSTDMQIDLTARRVTVWAHFSEDRGNPIGTWFARILGINSVNVVTAATAEADVANEVGCLTPWALPDMWVDTEAGGTPDKFDYDDADRSDTPTDGDSFDNYCPCVRNPDTGAIEADPDYVYNGLVCTQSPGNAQCTGWGSDLRNDGTYENDVGRQLTLKPGNPAQSWSPGWFLAWRPPDNAGGADYRQNIVTCIDEQMFDTGSIVPVDTEQGNMIGPTIQGVEERIGDDQHYWADGCTGGTSCIAGTEDGQPCGYGTDTACEDYGSRMVVVPLMDPTEVMRNGLTEIQFRGFIRLFLDDPSGNDITGHVLGLGGAAGSTDAQGTGALPLVIRLVK